MDDMEWEVDPNGGGGRIESVLCHCEYEATVFQKITNIWEGGVRVEYKSFCKDHAQKSADLYFVKSISFDEWNVANLLKS